MKTDRELTGQEEEQLLSYLPQSERKRIIALTGRHRKESLCAWALLAYVLRSRCPTLPEVRRGERGKPGFPSAPDICFSLSHTDGCVMVAVASLEIGVDLERIRPVPRRLANWYPAESPEAFFDGWVQREAQAKRTGHGILQELRQETLTNREAVLYHPFPGYAAAVSSAEEAPEEVRVCTLTELLEN